MKEIGCTESGYFFFGGGGGGGGATAARCLE